MNGVDVIDHAVAMNRVTLHAHKWTWNLNNRIFDVIKTMVKAIHVMLCAEHNRRGTLDHLSADYLRPMDSNEFYRMLGLQMMDYRATAGFWFESAASRAAASRAASTSPGAVPSPAKSAAPAKAPRQVKLSNSPDRINPLLEHIATDIATAREQYCFYCNVRSCFFQCKACTVPLHTPISSGGASNAWPCMARYHMPEFNKYNHAYSKAQGTEASWEVDPVVAAIRQADGKRRKKKDAGEEVTEFTTRKSPRL